MLERKTKYVHVRASKREDTMCLKEQFGKHPMRLVLQNTMSNHYTPSLTPLKLCDHAERERESDPEYGQWSLELWISSSSASAFL